MRRIYLYSVPEIQYLGKQIGLKIEATATAGLSRGGITLVVGAIKSQEASGNRLQQE